MNKCENFSARCLSSIIKADYDGIKRQCLHDRLEVISFFGPKDEERVRTVKLRPVVGHLLCNLGVELRFHDLDDDAWVAREISALADRVDIQGMLLVGASMRRMRQVEAYVESAFSALPRKHVASECDSSRAHKIFMLRATAVTNIEQERALTGIPFPGTMECETT
jgi:hypothetical protein